ncbi:MAG: Gfo/Idh/MocA family oxidoreductase [Chloroflexi bacterium]|nr:Gfo/Idh/MocA family oxidoreductase [Chloroflexota bacterium]
MTTGTHTFDLDLDYLPHLPEKTDYGIGCIGAGLIRRDIHMVAYENAGFNMVGVASRTHENARACAKARGIETVYETRQELLDDERIEILDIPPPPRSSAFLVVFVTCTSLTRLRPMVISHLAVAKPP